MNRIRRLLLFMSATLACANTLAPHEALMDEIEQAVVLPKGAQPLSAYGRNYALYAPGRVMATYLLPSPAPKYSDGCYKMGKTIRPCTKDEIEESFSSRTRRATLETQANTRRWYDDPNDLPSMFDGGCTQIKVIYDIPSHSIASVTCNGLA